ncbi:MULTISPECIES: hypothetical protein [Burkholderia]|uniref:hypothetical protein n=1 Tax=Burkholderia TaxID=32008 RepID=UPI00145624E0|nr:MULTISPECIES: hypothetical protein [Burkholderia]MDN7639244.1 hypothetical protein [Burkholderia cepacia]
MTNRDEQLDNSTAAPADRQRDEHRVIADAWLKHTLIGIAHMHRHEGTRREVAKRLF